MRKVIILTLLVLCQWSWAGVRPEAKMRKIAASKLLGNAAAASKLEILDENSSYRIYGKDQQGFVIVSTDENAKEVLGYSTKAYDKDNLPPAFKLWLKAIEVSTIDKTVNANYTVVPNFMTSTWGQGDPYNFLCPKIDEQLPPCGCVATAMGQIMYYYKFPAQGKGSGYYTIGGSNMTYKEDIKGVYLWDQMYDNYSYVTLTDEIRTPIATLLKDAGLGSHMDYNIGGSGTSEYDAATSFVENFSYAANQIRICSKEYYDIEEYNTIIYSELAANRPVFAVGADPTQGGHAFIFSGVDEEGRVYVNWGWNGDADGYYEMTTLNPKDILGNSSTMIFNLYNAVIVGIVPGTGDPSEDHVTSQWNCNGKLVISPWDGFDYMEVSISGIIYNASPFTFEGKIQLRFDSTDGDKSKDVLIDIVDTDVDGEVASGHGYQSISLNGFFASEINLKPGKYDVYLVSVGKGDTAPQDIRYLGGEKEHYLLTYENGVITVEEYQPTGIFSIYQTPTVSSARIFDLQGRRLGTDINALPKGIYIVNGRKVIK